MAVNHPQSNILTRALGTSIELKADVFESEWEAGDMLLICSDGL